MADIGVYLINSLISQYSDHFFDHCTDSSTSYVHEPSG